VNGGSPVGIWQSPRHTAVYPRRVALDPETPTAAAIDRLLAVARERIGHRPGPAAIPELLAAGALVVDTRPVDQRERDGELPGAVVIDRNVLEWRLDPTSPWRIAEMDDPRRRVVVVCDQGYSSSLAAAGLRDLGVDATDLAGGFQAWLAHVRP
jgi:rhodanese-related sulfurtransferase